MNRRPAPAPRTQAPIRPDTPAAGFYLTRLVRGGPLVTVRIWHGAPLDPATGEEIDRAHRWQMEIDGCITNRDGEPWSEDDVLDTYLFAAKRPIDAAEYAYRRATADHAKAHEPDMAEATPTKRINRMETPTPW